MEKQKRRKEILLENIEIIDTANKGKSIAKNDGRVIIVDGAVPGDNCDIIVYKKRKKLWQARVAKINTFSKKRTTPKCEHFGTCGGCKWQNMNYDSQLEFKQYFPKKFLEKSNLDCPFCRTPICNKNLNDIWSKWIIINYKNGK